MQFGDGNGGLGNNRQFETAGSAYAAVSDDFNGDGRRDLAVVARDSDAVSVHLGVNTGAILDPGTVYTVAELPFQIALDDLNQDGHADLVVSGLWELSILLGLGDGTFTTEVRYATPSGGTPAIADFDEDGLPDISTSGTVDGAVMPLFGDRGPDLVALAAGQFDDDSTVDLVTVDEGSDDVTVLLGDAASGFLRRFGPTRPC